MPRTLSLSFEGGLPERLMQATALVVSSAFFVAYLISRSLACLGLSGVYAFVWFDDGLSYHERAGIWLAETFGFGPRFGLRPQDQGELLAWAFAGAVLVVPLLLAWRRDVGADRAILTLFGLVLALLVATGGAADMVNSAVTDTTMAFTVMLVEDGGEMLAVAFAAAGALLLVRRQTAVPTEEPRARRIAASSDHPKTAPGA